MKLFCTTGACLTLALAGCMQGATARPGATGAAAKDSFKLSVRQPSGDLKQGATQSLTIAIQRDKSFDHDVVLKFGDQPTGVTLRPAAPVIQHDDNEVRLTLAAARNAALGNFAVRLSGHPTQGVTSTNEIRFTVIKQ